VKLIRISTIHQKYYVIVMKLTHFAASTLAPPKQSSDQNAGDVEVFSTLMLFQHSTWLEDLKRAKETPSNR